MTGTGSGDISYPVAKAGTALAAPAALLDFSSWADVAAFFALLYTLLLTGEWLWKKAGRPFMERRKWIRRKARRAGDG